MGVVVSGSGVSLREGRNVLKLDGGHACEYAKNH